MTLTLKKFDSKSKGDKNKNKQVGLYQTKRICTVNKIINKMKRQAMEREKIHITYTSDKGLLCKIYKELIQLNTRKRNNPI